MSFLHDFPYTNFHELNLDFILKEIININKKIIDFDLNQSVFNMSAEGADNRGIIPCDEILLKGINSNKPIIFSKGVYLIEHTVEINKPVIILGNEASIIMTDINQICFRVSANNTIISGLKFNTNANCVYLSVVENVHILNCEFKTRQQEAGFYQYAITISHSKYITVKDCIIMQPLSQITSYNNADGIHINGGSSFITIENVTGYTGDDFIALNAAEPATNPASISNVIIRNCHNIYNGVSSARGLRLYGNGENQKISDVLIEDCTFSSIETIRPVMITNSPSQTGDQGRDKITCENITFNRCKFINDNNGIIISYANINKININNPVYESNQLINVLNSNISTITVNELIGAGGIIKINTDTNIGRIFIDKSVFTSKDLSILHGNVDNFIINDSFISSALIISSDSTNGKIGNLTFNKVTFSNMNNPILYAPTSIAKFIFCTYVGNMYLVSLPQTCGLLIAEGNSFSSEKTNVNTIVNVTGLKRVKGFDIIISATPTESYANDHYVYNSSGNLLKRIYNFNKWQNIAVTDV